MDMPRLGTSRRITDPYVSLAPNRLHNPKRVTHIPTAATTTDLFFSFFGVRSDTASCDEQRPPTVRDTSVSRHRGEVARPVSHSDGGIAPRVSFSIATASGNPGRRAPRQSMSRYVRLTPSSAAT